VYLKLTSRMEVKVDGSMMAFIRKLSTKISKIVEVMSLA
jgi:hypothetical protein